MVRAQKAKAVDVPSKSVIAMAVGNALSGLIGGFGGCGLIPQTVLNMKSGGGGPLSSAVYAVSMALFVLVFAPLVAQIPQAALAGLMITVAISTIQWDVSLSFLKGAFRSIMPKKASGDL